jgi:hypothetical protein
VPRDGPHRLRKATRSSHDRHHAGGGNGGGASRGGAIGGERRREPDWVDAVGPGGCDRPDRVGADRAGAGRAGAGRGCAGGAGIAGATSSGISNAHAPDGGGSDAADTPGGGGSDAADTPGGGGSDAADAPNDGGITGLSRDITSKSASGRRFGLAAGAGAGTCSGARRIQHDRSDNHSSSGLDVRVALRRG